ncbi:hypothetical protein ACFFRR_011675 [Megaselia abdita]
MEGAWRFRILLVAVVAFLMCGDYFGYGSIRVIKSTTTAASTTGDAGFSKGQNQQTTEIEISEGPSYKTKDDLRAKFSDQIREACLSKILCEMASKPDNSVSLKWRNLLKLLKSSTLASASNNPPNKYYFAAHMGELLKYTGEVIGGPASGCSNLWPNCPISSDKLDKLSYKLNLK